MNNQIGNGKWSNFLPDPMSQIGMTKDLTQRGEWDNLKLSCIVRQTTMPYITFSWRQETCFLELFPSPKYSQSEIKFSSYLSVPETLAKSQNISFKQSTSSKEHTPPSFTTEAERRVPPTEPRAQRSRHPTGLSGFPPPAHELAHPVPHRELDVITNVLRWSDVHT